jgi:outer membrane protein OmpA-like peptidoglycan-associated protein
VTFKVNDGTDDSNTATQTIDFTAVNDPPALDAGGTTPYTENEAAKVITANLDTGDPDDTNWASAEVKITNAKPGDQLSYATTAGVSGAVNGAGDTVTLTGSHTIADYDAALQAVKYASTSDDPDPADRTVRFIANDGDNDSAPTTQTIDITVVNDAPVVNTTGSALTYNQADPAAAVDSGLAATDVDDTNLESAEVKLTNPQGGDELVYSTTAGVAGVVNGAKDTVTFTTSHSKADYQAALRAVSFQNNSPTVDTTARTVRFKVNDGALDSNLPTRTINVTELPPLGPPTIVEGPAAISGVNTAHLAFTGAVGATFECSLDDAAFAACTSPTDLTGLAEGAHNFRVRQKKSVLTSDAVAHNWTVDLTPPGAPTIIGGPDPETGDDSATLEFQVDPGSTAECSLDGAPFTPCVSPSVYNDLALGRHSFSVRQIDLAGNTSAAATRDWRIDVDFEPGGDGTNTKNVTGLVNDQTTPDDDQVGVGCELNRGSIEECEVDAFVDSNDANIAAMQKIGSGETVLDERGHRSTVVEVKLNSLGKKLMKKYPAGLKVIFEIVAKPFDSEEAFETTERTELRPPQLLAVPSAGLFAGDAYKLDAAGRRYVKAVAKAMKGAKRVQCEGHSDNSGTKKYEKQIALKRAKAVCAQLRKAGLKVKMKSVSYGAKRPRVSNKTAKGRRLNRRVEIRAWF